MPAPRTGLGCLASYEQVRSELDVVDTESDAPLIEMADTISSSFDSHCDRPLIYRGTLVSASDIVNAKSWITGPLTLEALAAAIGAPRSLHIEWTAAGPMGVVLVTGTLLGQPVNESFIAGTHPLRGTKLFDVITSAVVSGQASAAGTVSIGTVVPHYEYHSMRGGLPTAHAYLVNRPVFSVYEVNEDVSRNFAEGTRLTPQTDYVLANSSGKILKVKGLGLTVDFPEDYFQRFPQKLPAWTTAERAIRVIYTGGFKLDAARVNVPGDLKDGFLQTLAIRWRERNRKLQGMSSVSDAAGGTSRFSKGEIPEHVMKMLDTYKTYSMTGELEEP